jgi:DNA-damage-inducible protein J
MSVAIKAKTTKKAKSSLVQVRLDDKTKSEVEKILDALGLTTSQAVTIYLKQIVLKRKIPFEINTNTSANSNNDYDDSEMSQEEFRKMTGYLVGQLDKGEEIPEFNENNARPFTY